MRNIEYRKFVYWMFLGKLSNDTTIIRYVKKRDYPCLIEL